MNHRPVVDAVVYAPLEEEYLAIQRRFPPDDAVEGKNFVGYYSKAVPTKKYW